MNAPAFHSTSRVVLTDFVVRDKHLRLVKDLKAFEVEVFEDDLPQQVLSFEWVDGRSNAPHQASQQVDLSGSKQDANATLRDVSFVTIVYDNMSLAGRSFAARAVKYFLNSGISQNSYVGMFLMGYHLIQMQGYTNQAELLNAAADRAADKGFGLEPAGSPPQPLKLKSSSSGAPGGPQQQLDPSTFRPEVLGAAEKGGPEMDSRVASLEAGIQRLNTTMVNQIYGSTLLDELGALIQQQAGLPGRKTILFLSEGLTVAAESPERFRSVIGMANRANITFNTVNCKGLTTESRTDATARYASIQVGKWDVNENLHDLATETGGVAMDNSNDLRQPLARAMEAVQSHYEVTYQPQSLVNDGRYRKLRVSVRRPGLSVQSRHGYFALPLLNGQPLFPYEMAALNAVNTVPAPRAFPFDTSVLRFADTGGSRDTMMVFEVPTRNLRIQQAPNGNTFKLWLSFFGLVKDRAGNVITRVSRDFTYSNDVAKRAAFEAGVVSVALPLQLNSGEYTIDGAVIDREASRASTGRFGVEITKETYPYLSDTILVRRAERIGQNKSMDSPLDANGLRITPEIASTVTYNQNADVTLYLVAYPDSRASAKLRIDLRRDGRIERTFYPALVSSQLREGIPVLISIPMDTLSRGRYEVVSTIEQNGNSKHTVTSLLLQD